MRSFVMKSGALLGAGLAAGSAASARADGIALKVGGEYNAAYMAVFDDDGEGEPGNERNSDGIFQDAEIHFTGSTILDNGLELGARVELAGEDDEDQIDESWVYFSGGFGEIRVGSFDDALALLCVIPPGGTENFSAFSPNQWGANTLTSNSICTGVDDEGDAQKVLYLSPIFGGFQLGVSYTPSGDKKDHGDGVGAHTGMPVNVEDASRHNVSLYGTYSYEAEDWSLQVGLGGSWEGNVEKAEGEPNREESEFYQAGILLGFGEFEIGASFEYYGDDDVFVATLENGDVAADRWVLGVGAAYEMAPWTFGIGYSINDTRIDIEGAPDERLTQQRTALTVDYSLAPGIDLDGEIAYTWSDTDSEDAPDFAGFSDYDAIEIGTGIAIEF
ncbi:MAG TPA: porin [Dongiaceae bacterium]|nr:porin [Dongiaceae bacterium]